MEPAKLVIRAVGDESGADQEPAAEGRFPSSPPRPVNARACARSISTTRPSNASPAPEAPLLVWTTEATCVPRVWAWHGELQSRYAPDGGGQHAAVYRLQSCGETSIRLTLPRGTSREDIQGVWIDGLPAAVRQEADDPQAILIDLPPNEKYPSVTIHFSTRGGRLGTIGRLEPPLPRTDAPVLWRQWSVWLPPGYELAEHLPDDECSPPRQASWSQRLFGPLGRATEAAAPRRRIAAPPSESDSLWAPTRSGGFEPEDSRGWLVYRFPVSDAAAIRPVVVHRAAMRLVGLLAFLVALRSRGGRRSIGPWPF